MSTPTTPEIQAQLRATREADAEKRTRIPMSEADWQRRVTDYAELKGLLWFHSGDSRRDSSAGFPDLAIVGPSGIAYLELKREDGRVSLDQKRWLNALRTAGANAVIARPRHWPDVKNLLDALAVQPSDPEGPRR